MGSDMLVQYVAIKQKRDNVKEHKLLEEEIIERVTKQMSLADLDVYCDKVYGEWMADHYRNSKSHDEVAMADFVRNEIIQTVKETFESLGYRDVGMFRFKGFNFYITGGLSSSDPPTDTYSVFEKFNALHQTVRGDDVL
jgi:hypothetical protein